MFLLDGRGRRVEVGEVLNSGAEVDGVNRIVDRLMPPYVDRRRVRVHVIKANVWNAAAMENGSTWVYEGLLNDVSGDELAITLGHELAHFTHEHLRRAMRNAMLVQMTGALARLAVQKIDSPPAR